MKARGDDWGATPGPEGVRFRVFAPGSDGVEVVIGDGTAARAVALDRDRERGVWSGTVPDVRAGALYRYRLGPNEPPLADPASRFQPQGVEGPSEVIDPTFAWTDASFAGIPARGRVLYELHVGTFTTEGTWEAARARLPDLARLGVTVIEVMPIAEFAGARGWGYDGVFWFAPYHPYGRPEDLRRFIDDAHRLGLGVILDVVYNHLGNVGNVLPRYSRDYESAIATEWGGGLNFDTGEARPLRAFVLANLAYWIESFHFDGFRFDATQSITDTSTPHILIEAVEVARAAAGAKSILLTAENEPQDSWLARPRAAGGMGFDSLWNDDFHHVALVALTGHREAYFGDYTGSARELAACVSHGFLFQGQRYRWQKKPRGRSTRGLPPRAFVSYLENHDQIANYGLGERLWSRVAPGVLRALTALTLLGPATPLLFQGQEWHATARFAYFTDHDNELARIVKSGRAQFLQQFPRYCGPDARDRFPDPGLPETFAACRLDWGERDAPMHARALAMHRDLLELRRADPTLQREGQDGVVIETTALTEEILIVRYFGVDESGREDRLFVVNLDIDLDDPPLAEPLIAPPDGLVWRPVWSTDDPRYGGNGVRGAAASQEIFLPGQAAVFMAPALEEVPA